MSAITQTSATAGQIKQINRFGSDAIEQVLGELDLDKPGAQCVIEHGDEFKKAIRTAVLASIRNLSIHKFKNEEVISSHGYPSDYKKPKHVAQQINIIRELFPEVNWGYFRPDENEIVVPATAEGLFAIPRWEKIAPTYGEAVKKVLTMIEKTRNGDFHNYCEGQLGPDKLRQSTKSTRMFQKLGDEQKDYDILVVPAQFGLQHRGRSVRRAREVFIQTNEFGLGAFAVGIMILTHLERLQHNDDLRIDCAGDEYAPDANGDFSFSPFFEFTLGQINFDICRVVHARANFGSVSAFVS